MMSRSLVRGFGRRVAALSALCSFLSAQTANANTLIAGWDFQTTTTGGTALAAQDAAQPTAYVANFGSGTLFLSGTNGSSLWLSGTTTARELNAFGGTAINATNGLSTTTTAPAALALVNQSANGKAGVFRFSMTGFQDLVISLAAQRTSTGFTTQTWEFSTDGTTYSSIGLLSSGSTAGTIRDSFANTGILTLPTVTGLNNAANAWVRVTLTGATASSGNNRLDNIQFVGSTFVPPGITYTWTGTGGGGTWANGSQGSFNTTYANSPTTAAVFAGTGEAVTVDAAGVEAGSLTFQSNGYSLAGGSVTLGQGAVTVNAATTASVLSVVTGTAGITKAGSGTLLLDAANTFSGTVNVSAGTLEVLNDAALGNTANDVAVAGTLRTPNSLALGADRTITGAGTLDIAAGTTLTVNGPMTMTAVTLANSGTLSLQGSTRSVGNLTINAPAEIQAAGPISATGLTAPGVTTGTATISPAIVFTTGDKTMNVPGGGTVVLQSDVSGLAGNNWIVKTGSGTLRVNGSLGNGGLRVGSAGSNMVDGGNVILAQATSTGTSALQLNFGTLSTSASGGITTSAGLSVGGRTTGVAVLDGTEPITFNGQSSFFRGTNTSGELRLNVNNTMTLAGGFAATGGGGSATGITIGGTGTLILGGDGTALTDRIALIDTVNLELGPTASLGGGVTVGANNVLAGNGTIGGVLAGAGSVQPGASPGILAVGQVDPALGLDFLLEFTGAAPNYANVAASVNDVVRVTGATPFVSSLTPANVVNVFLSVPSITDGNTFAGGFFTNTAGDFTSSVSGATINYFVLGDGQGFNATLDGQGYYSFASWKTATGADPALALSLGTVAQTANFASGVVNGQAMVISAVPEPSALGLAATAAGLAMAGLARSRRRA